MCRYTVDRIEGDQVVVECPDGRICIRPREQMPAGVREGDRLRRAEGGWEIDARDTARARERAKSRLDKFRRSGRENP
ncbi:MAG: DUF3006 domain-containing protein [Christensenellales bacterium]|jgi:hypothetical protein